MSIDVLRSANLTGRFPILMKLRPIDLARARLMIEYVQPVSTTMSADTSFILVDTNKLLTVSALPDSGAHTISCGASKIFGSLAFSISCCSSVLSDDMQGCGSIVMSLAAIETRPTFKTDRATNSV